MTDAKLYVDRVHMAVGSDLASSVGPIVFGRDMHGASPSPQPKAGKPDPFGQTSKVRAAMDAHPAHLAGSRWPVERVATDFAFRLEQIGTSIETCTRNLARLCTSLKIGVVDEDKVVAIAPADVQRIAAVWGIVIDKAQVRELFALRKLDPGAPVPISIFVRRFTESVSAIGGVLDRSLPRSTTRAPPIDYGGGSGPYSGGKPNAVEEARSQSYKTIGARHLATYKEASCKQVAQRAPAQLSDMDTKLSVLHTRMEQCGMTRTHVIRKVIRTLGSDMGGSAASAMPLSSEQVVQIASALGVKLAPGDADKLLAEYGHGDGSVIDFANQFLDSYRPA